MSHLHAARPRGSPFLVAWLALALLLCCVVREAGAAQAFSRVTSIASSLPEVVFEPNVYRLVDWNRDGHPDLVHIKTVTGSGATQVHIYDGASRYQRALLSASTALHEVTRAGIATASSTSSRSRST